MVQVNCGETTAALMTKTRLRTKILICLFWAIVGPIMLALAFGAQVSQTCVPGNPDYEKGSGFCSGNGRKDEERRKAADKAEKAKKLEPVQFGTGDDAAAWLSRCAPPESDTTTAYDDPRPPIVTRFLSYPSKSVRVILVPNGPMGSPPPFSSWRLMGVTDPGNNQPIEPKEALRRMGDSCRRG
jgi:hypothetical protein